MKVEKYYHVSSRRKWRQRFSFGALFLLTAGTGITLFADFLWRTGLYGIKYAILILFAILFSMLSFGFCSAFFGFIARRSRNEIKVDITDVADLDELPATAIVIPVYNEDVARVFAGVRTTYETLQATGKRDRFDLFVLSDTTDPDLWAEEEAQWLDLCRELKAFGRIYYRHRNMNTDRKAGNLHDFLVNWGANYEYMIVFDADSIMSGPSMVKMVGLMEANARCGLLQTVPALFGGQTLYARSQQFAARMYGQVFAAGLNYWQLGEGNYWGHNAIIRIKPFMDHCALPDLPYKEPLGGKILSHDFVEAALMKRGGYEVWLAYDMDGSYEEGPPNLIACAQRDRRWCQGNLQHGWLLFTREFSGINRLHFLLGIMAYANSLFWLLFLVCSTLAVVAFERSGLSLIAVSGLTQWWDMSLQQQGLVLLGMSAFLLFSPKLFAVLDLLFDAERRRSFGGIGRAGAGAITETLVSIAMAPILMLFHSLFIVYTVIGLGTSWGPQNRDNDKGVAYADAVATHLHQTVIGVLWCVVAFYYDSVFFAWLSPVTVMLALSIPISMLLGSVKVGRWFKKQGLMLVPEEIEPSPLLSGLDQYTDENRRRLGQQLMRGTARALMDPYLNAIHRALLLQTEQPALTESETVSVEKLVSEGINKLDTKVQRAILSNPSLVAEAYDAIWHARGDQPAQEWVERMRRLAHWSL